MPQLPLAHACAVLAPCSSSGWYTVQSGRKRGVSDVELGLQWREIGLTATRGEINVLVSEQPGESTLGCPEFLSAGYAHVRGVDLCQDAACMRPGTDPVAISSFRAHNEESSNCASVQLCGRARVS